jgi:hypothetical protein
MPRPLLGPRLYLRRRSGSATWVIRHQWRMIATGCGESERERAEEMLNNYCIRIDAAPDVATPPQVMREQGFIYFVTCDAPDFPIKIGWSKDCRRRAFTLQVSLPYKLVVLGTRPGTLEDERDLHLAFSADRLEGEWFRRTPELLAHTSAALL